MKKILILVALLLICRVTIATDLPVKWSDTIAATDTASVDTTIAYSKWYHVYDPGPVLYYYVTFKQNAVPALQATRNCSLTVALQYAMDQDTTRMGLFDSTTFAAIIRDTSIYRSKRIKLDSVTADSILPRAKFVRAKVTKKVTYLAADTSNVGSIYPFDVHVDLSPRY